MTHGGLTHGGGSMVVRYGGSMVETHGAGGTYPISQPSACSAISCDTYRFVCCTTGDDLETGDKKIPLDSTSA